MQIVSDEVQKLCMSSLYVDTYMTRVMLYIYICISFLINIALIYYYTLQYYGLSSALIFIDENLFYLLQSFIVLGNVSTNISSYYY